LPVGSRRTAFIGSPYATAKHGGTADNVARRV
jgi:hypothetical protein